MVAIARRAGRHQPVLRGRVASVSSRRVQPSRPHLRIAGPDAKMRLGSLL